MKSINIRADNKIDQQFRFQLSVKEISEIYVFSNNLLLKKLKHFLNISGQDALDLGANAVVISTYENEMEAVKGKFDLIIDTVPYDHDINPYINTLNISGTLVLVGYIGQMGDALFTPPLILGRRSVAGSVIGGIKETQEMLDFCGEHNILPEIEMINMQDINTAYERMLKSDVRYRFVIDMQSLKG